MVDVGNDGIDDILGVSSTFAEDDIGCCEIVADSGVERDGGDEESYDMISD